MIDLTSALEKRRLRKAIRNLYHSKYAISLKQESRESENFAILSERFERESAPLRARMREIESTALADRAMSYNIVPANLAPLQFGNPLWLSDAGCRYLSEEGAQAVRRAIAQARDERIKFWASIISSLSGVITAIAGLAAALAGLTALLKH